MKISYPSVLFIICNKPNNHKEIIKIVFIVIYLRKNSKNRKYLFSKTIFHMTVDLYCNGNSTRDSHFSLKFLDNFKNKMNRFEPEIHAPSRDRASKCPVPE